MLKSKAYISGQTTIIPKPELRSFWGDSPTKPPFGVTSAEVVIICPDIYIYIYTLGFLLCIYMLVGRTPALGDLQRLLYIYIHIKL